MPSPDVAQANTLIGIDLGTSNSAVSLWQNGQAILLPNAEGEHLTPSVVGIDDHGQFIVGQAAKSRLQSHPQLTAASFKRQMGADYTFHLGQHKLRPEELSALLLQQLKADAERYLGYGVSDAIITVPAYFNNVQRQAVKTAGRIAGLNVVRLLNEPTAASLAYGLLNNTQQKYLTFDLGGGTFDVSVIDMFEGVIEVRASCGDIFLGGDDFTRQIYQWMLQVHPLSSPEASELSAHLTLLAEKMKCDLTFSAHTRAQLVWQGQTYEWQLNETLLAEICEELLNRLKKPVLQALRDARFSSDELDHVLLVGGATRMPLIRQAVTRMFGHFPRTELNPDEAVALGAGIQAGMVLMDQAVEDIILTDVMPYSLGIGVARQNHESIDGGYFLPLIERNSFVPVSTVQRVNTVYDHQQQVDVQIYQGEARKVAENILLGQLNLPVPRRKAGEVSIDIRFTYTLDGILEVECRLPDSDQVTSMIIERVPGQMSEEEIHASLLKLAAMKQHPREYQENKLLLAQGAQLYERCLAEERTTLDTYISYFELALDSQNVRRIATTRDELKAVIAHFSDERL
ncbi:molecular chaperone DnaK [Yersinia mollaretii]|uniref:Hsp70 family protein n=1 Tax=Yersinia mollaretii TaxID=33060 RepID=UPI0005E01394|nr:molecular chaperone HscC [Yersinia mollaretii]CNK16366.1 molecular chaperone DnaK [Yersinia mollaretii]